MTQTRLFLLFTTLSSETIDETDVRLQISDVGFQTLDFRCLIFKF